MGAILDVALPLGMHDHRVNGAIQNMNLPITNTQSYLPQLPNLSLFSNDSQVRLHGILEY